MCSKFYQNSKQMQWARENRKKMTKAEASLWKYGLSRNQMMGYRFRRQHPIGPFIVDFACSFLKLVIEVDGYSHQIPENEEYDIERQKKLEQLGYTVLRFPDQMVLNEIKTVKDVIEGWVRKLEASSLS